MNPVCEMIFATSLDGTRVIRVPDPRDGITAANVELARDRFIMADPFNDEVGSLVSLKRADMVRQQRTVLIPLVA